VGKCKSKVARFDVLTVVLPRFRSSEVRLCVFFLSNGVAVVDECTALSRNVGKNVITLHHILEDLKPQGQIFVFLQSRRDLGEILVVGKTFSRPFQAEWGRAKLPTLQGRILGKSVQKIFVTLC
jgi:hypothetical protein